MVASGVCGTSLSLSARAAGCLGIFGAELHHATAPLSLPAPLQGAEMAVEDLSLEEQAELEAIRGRKTQIVAAHRRKKSAANNHSLVPQKVDRERATTTANMKVTPLQRPQRRSPRTAYAVTALVPFLVCQGSEAAYISAETWHIWI